MTRWGNWPMSTGGTVTHPQPALSEPALFLENGPAWHRANEVAKKSSLDQCDWPKGAGELD